MALVVAFFTGWFHALPQAVLAATIIVAVTGLIDWDAARGLALRQGRCAVADRHRVGVMALGVEAGILLGVALSLGTLVWRSSHPHMAVVGRVPGTEHFRNVDRHQVVPSPAWWRCGWTKACISPTPACCKTASRRWYPRQPRRAPCAAGVLAVNQIDATALGCWAIWSAACASAAFAFAGRGQGPVMDRLQDTDFGRRMQGQVFLSTHEAFADVAQRHQAG